MAVAPSVRVSPVIADHPRPLSATARTGARTRTPRAAKSSMTFLISKPPEPTTRTPAGALDGETQGPAEVSQPSEAAVCESCYFRSEGRNAMATARKIELLKVKLDPRPGALAEVLGAFREAKVNLTASWAYQMGPGEAEANFFTADLDRARQALTKLGKKPSTQTAFWVDDA